MNRRGEISRRELNRVNEEKNRLVAAFAEFSAGRFLAQFERVFEMATPVNPELGAELNILLKLTRELVLEAAVSKEVLPNPVEAFDQKLVEQRTEYERELERQRQEISGDLQAARTENEELRADIERLEEEHLMIEAKEEELVEDYLALTDENMRLLERNRKIERDVRELLEAMRAMKMT
jgi:septal ring factor EnvC (AmiA/AmiB activator)